MRTVFIDQGDNIYLPEQDLIFLRIPQSGGVWRQGAMRFSCKFVGDGHATLSQIQTSEDLPLQNAALFLTSIDSWYEAVWTQFSRQRLSTPDLEETRLQALDACFDPQLNTFVQNVLDLIPGFYSHYAIELSAGAQNLCFGRSEHNLRDLTRILAKHGVPLPSRARHIAVTEDAPQERIDLSLVEQLLAAEATAREGSRLPAVYRRGAAYEAT